MGMEKAWKVPGPGDQRANCCSFFNARRKWVSRIRTESFYFRNMPEPIARDFLFLGGALPKTNL
jgi:hypothetical protein